jgi:hypothetical protein
MLDSRRLRHGREKGRRAIAALLFSNPSTRIAFNGQPDQPSESFWNGHVEAA